MFPILILSILVFAVVMAAMAIGVIFQGKCIRGHCGGEEIIGPDGGLLNCETCPVREGRGGDSVGTSL